MHNVVQEAAVSTRKCNLNTRREKCFVSATQRINPNNECASMHHPKSINIKLLFRASLTPSPLARCQVAEVHTLLKALIKIYHYACRRSAFIRFSFYLMGSCVYRQKSTTTRCELLRQSDVTQFIKSENFVHTFFAWPLKPWKGKINRSETLKAKRKCSSPHFSTSELV